MKDKELKKFEEIVKEYQKAIINFHYRFVGNRFEAEDLAQETFIKTYLKLDTLKDKGKLKSWLFSISRNVVIDFFRKNKNREIALASDTMENLAQLASSGNGIDIHEKIRGDDVSRELERCIDQLLPQDKMIIKLLYYEGFSYKEISELMRINENTLKSRLHRARTILYQTMKGNDLLREVALQYKQ